MVSITDEMHAVTLDPTPVGMNISCGMKQMWLFSGQTAQNPEQELLNAMKGAERHYKGGNAGRCAMYVFSDRYNYHKPVFNAQNYEKEVETVETAHHGHHFAAYLVEQGLGVVTASPEAINPNTGHRIRCWIWNVDHAALTKWCEARGVKNVNDLPITEGAARGVHT